MSSIFCRVGSKKPIKELVISSFPDNFELYVEPFIGSGVIFLSADLENKKSVINDLDKSLINGYRAIKKGITLDENTFTFTNNPIKQEQYYKKKHIINNNNTAFISTLIQTCGTFSSRGIGKIYKPVTEANFRAKIKKAKLQKDYFKNTSILNNDYKLIINKFDNKNTFFYLDPPYEKSKGLYKNFSIDLNEMSNILKNIKGKFLLSINDSSNIRTIFSNFNITSINVKGGAQIDVAPIGGTIRKELLITNY
tara:strand:+ start:86 stop:841 length:756 start_codon:yes stop_codon:yes gene_type:complete